MTSKLIDDKTKTVLNDSVKSKSIIYVKDYFCK